MPTIREPEQLLLQEIRMVYQAEKLIQRAMPKIAKRAQNNRLREALDHRREESQHLVQELDQALEGLGSTRGRARNEVVEALIEQITTLADDIDDPELLDAATLGSVQKLEHYCIGTWGMIAALSRALDHQDLVQAMEQALDEGKRFDDDLTELAESDINPAALQTQPEGDDDEEESDEDDEEEITARSGGRGRNAARASGRAVPAAGRGAAASGRNGAQNARNAPATPGRKRAAEPQRAAGGRNGSRTPPPPRNGRSGPRGGNRTSHRD